MKKTVSLRVIVILISLFMGLRIESASFVRRRSGANCQIRFNLPVMFKLPNKDNPNIDTI